MGNALSALSVLVFLLGPHTLEQAGADQAGREWLREPPKANEAWTPLPATDVYEVVASKEIVAIFSDLAKKPWVPLKGAEHARYFTGHYYRVEAGKRAFLVRSVYGQGGTGSYALSRRGDDLHVHHASLGGQSAYRKSALVVNLDFEPGQVYITMSIDQ